MTLDANIVIAYLGGEKEVVEILSRWRQEGLPIFVSTVVETEVLSFAELTTHEITEVQNFFEENCFSIPFDRKIAHLAAQIRRSVKIKFPDAAIAATALSTNTPLATRNVTDFRRIHGLKIVTI